MVALSEFGKWCWMLLELRQKIKNILIFLIHRYILFIFDFIGEFKSRVHKHTCGLKCTVIRLFESVWKSVMD